jgi:hypothetical protein
MNDSPAGSNAFWFASEIMAASETVVTSGSGEPSRKIRSPAGSPCRPRTPTSSGTRLVSAADMPRTQRHLLALRLLRIDRKAAFHSLEGRRNSGSSQHSQ